MCAWRLVFVLMFSVSLVICVFGCVVLVLRFWVVGFAYFWFVFVVISGLIVGSLWFGVWCLFLF